MATTRVAVRTKAPRKRVALADENTPGTWPLKCAVPQRPFRPSRDVLWTQLILDLGGNLDVDHQFRRSRTRQMRWGSAAEAVGDLLGLLAGDVEHELAAPDRRRHCRIRSVVKAGPA